MKTCSKCGDRKELDAFPKAKGCKDGVRPVCGRCVYEERAAKIKGDHALLMQHREFQRNWARKNRSANPSADTARCKRWREKNKESENAKGRARYQENRDVRRAKRAAYKKAHPEVIRDYERRAAQDLRNHYVHQLIQRAGFPASSASLVEAKREHIRLLRLVKEMKQQAQPTESDK